MQSQAVVAVKGMILWAGRLLLVRRADPTARRATPVYLFFYKMVTF